MLKPQLTTRFTSPCKPPICFGIAFWKKDDDLGSNLAFGKTKQGNGEVMAMQNSFSGIVKNTR
jgi:hypothetical protein